MTTTLPTPAPPAAALAVPAVPAPPSRCPIERRALHSGAADLATALTGIAFDAPCRPDRQRAILAFSAGVLRAVRGVAGRRDDETLRMACDRVVAATPLFASGISAGAPGLAGAWAGVADLLAADGEPVDHTAGELLDCERRFRTAVGQASFGVPWFLDSCSPLERVRLIAVAPRCVRLALRLGEDGWLSLRDVVRG
jgi:hypothetical protein